MLEGAQRAQQTVTPDWMPVGRRFFDGVEVVEIRNVFTRAGALTECFRAEWFKPPFTAGHVVHASLLPGGISQWHCHQRQTDVIIAVHGQLRIGLYDDRVESRTRGEAIMLNVGAARPTALRVPPLVWHAIRNPGGNKAAYIVVNDEPYNYAEPDDWVLPPGSNAIPLRLD